MTMTVTMTAPSISRTSGLMRLLLSRSDLCTEAWLWLSTCDFASGLVSFTGCAVSGSGGVELGMRRDERACFGFEFDSKSSCPRSKEQDVG